MGVLTESFGIARSLLPERKVAVGATVQTWESGTPQHPKDSPYRYALDGYSSNEVMFACIEELATSAAEPRLVAVKRTPDGPEQINEHPVLDLFERPNPFMSRYELIASLIMYRMVAGNGFLEKTRSGARKVVELWPLRPDRMWVIPDRERHIRGWEYRLGADVFTLDAADVIHSKTRNPLDDYYGMPPARPAAGRIDTANAMRSFTGAFFRNAGVPAGLLTVSKSVGEAEKELIKNRFRGDVGGPAGWHSLLVLDSTEASYTAMGLPLGERGLVLPDLDEILDAKIAMPFGVPLELIGARLGMVHGNRTTMKEARAGFWDETLAPLYQEIAATLSLALVGEFDGFDYLEFDLSTVRALQEDQDAKHTRIRGGLLAGIYSIQEARVLVGEEPDFDPDAILMLPDNLSPVLASEMLAPPVPAPIPPGLPKPPGANGTNGNGQMSAADIERLAALRGGA
jgi:HK97 family phage portal protein